MVQAAWWQSAFGGNRTGRNAVNVSSEPNRKRPDRCPIGVQQLRQSIGRAPTPAISKDADIGLAKLLHRLHRVHIGSVRFQPAELILVVGVNVVTLIVQVDGGLKRSQVRVDGIGGHLRVSTEHQNNARKAVKTDAVRRQDLACAVAPVNRQQR